MEVSILQHANDKSPQTVDIGQVAELIRRTDWPPGYQLHLQRQFYQKAFLFGNDYYEQLLGLPSIRTGKDAGKRLPLARDGTVYYNPQADSFLAWEVKDGCRRQSSRPRSREGLRERKPGYHYVVRRNGQVEAGRPEWMVGAHCQNHNSHSIGVCYEGGLDIRGQPADTRTEAQRTALRTLLEELHRRYPRALIVGHHDLNPRKACPCIDNVAQEYADLQPAF